MVTLEPFRHERCTAFKERVEIANKVNEVIDYINDDVTPFVEQYESVVETVENHTEEIESLEDDFNTLNTSISDLEDTVDTIDNDIDSIRTTVNGIQTTINGIQTNVNTVINEVNENTVKKTQSGYNTNAVITDDARVTTNERSMGITLEYGSVTDTENYKFIGVVKGSDGKIQPITVSYTPTDENDNPIVPAFTNVIMTSKNLDVDPRITGKATIDYVDESVGDVQNAVDKITDEWMLVPDDEFGSIFVNYKPTTDLILKLQLSLNNPSVYGTELFYLPKGVLIGMLPIISRTIRTSSTSIDFVKISCPLNVLNVYNYSTIDTSRITLDLSNLEVTITTDQTNFGKQSDAGSSGNFVNIYRRKTVND